MREYLFRGKRKDNGEWVEGYYFHYSTASAEVTRIRSLDGSYSWIVDPATVGQFTGLMDKNGKRVFEGDVFEWGYAGVKEFRYVVTYEATLASFVGERHFGFVSLNGIDLEIIGNIHDNPELVEGVI